MSVAYPLVCALPVILVVVITVVLNLGKPLSLVGVVGILAVAFGCLLLPLRSLRQVHLRNYSTACCLLAGLAALGTTGYTLVDNLALLDLRSAPGFGLDWIESAFFIWRWRASQSP
jgi:drug/metabolite transporter (DMT)-like permease